MTAFKDEFGSPNTDELTWNFVSMLHTYYTCCCTIFFKIDWEEN
jgi:hypothetical protein